MSSQLDREFDARAAAKHTVLIAVTVDTKYTASQVAGELRLFLPYMSSNCLDTVTASIPARIKKQVKSYQVWCSEHVASFADNPNSYDFSTYSGLLAVEADTGNSFSSYITTDDILSIVNAVNNEFNGELLYEEVTL